MPLWLALLAAMVCATQPKQQRCRARPELHFVAVQSVHGILVLTRQLQQQPATSAAACSVLHSKLEARTFVDPRCIACAEQVMLFSVIKRMRRDHVNICFAPELVSHQRCSSENPREVLLDRSVQGQTEPELRKDKLILPMQQASIMLVRPADIDGVPFARCA